MLDQQKIGIVTVTYNSAEVLSDFFRSLWAQTHTNFVLYAIDNASKDATISLLHAETDARLRVIANSTNVGVAEGNNVGIRLALSHNCDAVLLLNNDVAFPPDLLSKLVHSLNTTESHMVAPKMMYYDQPDKIWWAGGHFQKFLGYRVVHRGIDQFDTGLWDTPSRVAYTPTCCVLIRNDVFSTIGLMDPKYFVYCDDTDFMLRAARHKVCLQYEPSAVLYHKVSSLTKGSDSPFSVRILARNRVYFWVKHLGFSIALIYATFLIALYLFRCFLGRKSWEVFDAQYKAMIDGFRLA